MILKAQNISIRMGKRLIVDDVSLSSKPGRLIGLIGPNGAGKSTLLKSLAGLVQPDCGQLDLGGENLSEMTVSDRARILAYMPQERILSWPISVYDLVAMGRLPFQHPLMSLNGESKDAITHALAGMSVEMLAHRPANELSGGELARVLLARALAQTPKILLADEPTAGLDPAHKLHLLQHLGKITSKGMSVIVVLHDLTMAARFCDHLVLLQEGRIYASGEPTNVLTHQAMGDVYQIRAHIEEAKEGLVITPFDFEEPPS